MELEQWIINSIGWQQKFTYFDVPSQKKNLNAISKGNVISGEFSIQTFAIFNGIDEEQKARNETIAWSKVKSLSFYSKNP